MLLDEGNAYSRLNKTSEAVAAYTAAAGMDPNSTVSAVAYFNLCATQYNSGNAKEALDACEHAIAATPDKADAYFIKASVLIAGSVRDQDDTVKAPPGTVEALQKYLELAPDGAHAPDAKQMLSFIGSRVPIATERTGPVSALQLSRAPSDLVEGLLIKRVDPSYPNMAKIAHVHGDVLLQVVIDKHGIVQDPTVMSGHPMLIQAAVDAVRQWRYRPYLLNGEPVDVATSIIVKFHM